MGAFALPYPSLKKWEVETFPFFSIPFSLLKKDVGDKLGVKVYHGHRATAIT